MAQVTLPVPIPALLTIMTQLIILSPLHTNKFSLLQGTVVSQIKITDSFIYLGENNHNTVN